MLAGANYTDNTWTNQSVYLAPVNGSDILSGHSTTTYAVSGANTLASTSSATTLVNAGTSTVMVTTTDIAGNIATNSYTVKIDKTLPTVGTMTMKLGSVAGANYTDNTWTNQSVYLEPVNGSDAESGHYATTYVVSGANTVASTSGANIITNSGTSTVTVTTIDIAGNTATYSYTIKIDKTSPIAGTMTMKLGSAAGTNYTDNTWTNQSVYLLPVNGSDALSGHSTTTYAVSGANTVASTSGANTITNSGTSTVIVTTTDIAGNIATRSYTIKIDKTSPIVGTMTMKLGSAAGANYTNNTWTNQSIYLLSINGTDGESGHNSTTYTVSGANTITSTSGANTITNSGTSTVTVTTTDVAGNTSTRSYTVNIDKTPPIAGTMTMKLGNAAGANYTDNTWTNQSVYLAPVNGSDALSGHSSTTYAVSGANTVASTSGANTITNGGLSTVTVTTTDIVGNTATRTYTIKIDKTLPTVVFGTNGASNVTSANTTATVSDSGGSGLSTIQYVWSTSTTEPASGWASFTNGSNLTCSTNGSYYLWIKGTDGAGNIATTRSNVFTIDNVAPTTPTLSLSPTGWTNGNVTVTITYSADSATKQYSTNGTTWNTYSSAVIVSTKGTTVYARGSDLAGNMSLSSSTTVSNIDSVPTTVTFSPNGGNVTTASTTVTVSDSGGSGISSTQYVWSTSTTTPTSGWTSFTNGSTLTYATNGTYYLWIKGIDGAGNVTNTRSNAFVINNDTTPPAAPTFTLSPSTWTKNSVSVTITYSADTVTKQYSTNGGSSWSTYTSAVVVSINNTIVQARAYDAAGNMSNNSRQVTIIDTTAPTVTFSPNGGSSYPASSTVTVSDSQSGVNTRQYVWTTSTATPTSGWVNFANGQALSRSIAGTCYLWIQSTDVAGNTITTRSNSFTIVVPDTTPPTAPTFTLSPTGATNQNVNVTINYSGDTATKQYSTNGGSSWSTYTSAVVVTTNNTTVYARAYDAAGNMSTSSKQVTTIDKIAPTVTITTTTGTTPKATATISGNDTGGSGVSSIQYQWTTSTSTTAPTSGWITGTSPVYSTAGTEYLWAKVTDGAGNFVTQRAGPYWITIAYVKYQAHMSHYGWTTSVVTQPTVAGFKVPTYDPAGTWGPLRFEELRMQGINMNSASELNILVRAHVSNIGWQSWKQIMPYLNSICGKEHINDTQPAGPIYGIEALEMQLTGTLASKYQLRYKGYGPYGTVGTWVDAPGTIGSMGNSRAMYGIEIELRVR